jgi:cation diffusion facilitator CzcD-associated flavoprotein CzcO
MASDSGRRPTPREAEDLRQRVNAPIHRERHVKVICVGAGASGLCLAYKIQRHFDNVELQIYEKNPQISGTWFENR